MVGCFGLNLDWANRTDLQKVAFVVSVIVVIGAILCVIANISIAVEGDKGNWFSNSLQQRVFFFIIRSYAIIFSALVVVAEFHVVPIVNTYAKMFRFFWVRGMLQVFVGMLTIAGDFSPPGSSTASKALAAIGWLLVAIGAGHFVLAACCFKEYSVALKHADISEMAPGAQIDMTQVQQPQPGAAPSAAGGDNNNTFSPNINASASAAVTPTFNPYPRANGSAGDFDSAGANSANGANYRI